MLRALATCPGCGLASSKRKALKWPAVAEQRLGGHRGEQVGDGSASSRASPTARQAKALMNEVPLVNRQALLGLEREGLEAQLGQGVGGLADARPRAAPRSRRRGRAPT